MESNKEEARRAKAVAEKKFEENDLAGAKKFALKAQQMYPTLEGLSHLIAVIDVHIAAADVNGTGLPNWYAILQVSSAADEAIIKKQYRRLALLLHPDKNKSVGAEAAFKLIGEASGLLSNPANRAVYDRNRNKDPPSAFWTLCSTCNVRLQFHTTYLNCYLICPQCATPFMAVPIAAPASHPARRKGKGRNKENQMPAQNKDQRPSKPRPCKRKDTENAATKPQPPMDKEKESHKDQAATKPQPPMDKESHKDQAATKPQPPKDKESHKDQAATKPQPSKDKESHKDQAAMKPQPPKDKEGHKDQAAMQPQPPKDKECRKDQAAMKPQAPKDKESHKDQAATKSQPSMDNYMPTHKKDQAATKPQPPKEKENAKKRKGKKDVKFDRTAFDRLFAGSMRGTSLDEQSNKRAKIQVN